MSIRRNLNTWVNGDSGREAVRRTIDEMDQRLDRLAQMLSQVATNNGSNGNGLTAQQRSDVAGLIGALAQGVIGQATPDPVLPGQIGGGTVISVTAGNGLGGGTISTTGTISLLIGSANAVQKSNGTRLVNSTIFDDGTNQTIGSGATGAGLASAPSTTTVGDWNGNGNGTKITVDDTAALILLTNLPLVDPGIPGALWNNAGVVTISP